MDYVHNIRNAYATVKSGRWSSMHEAVTGFIGSVMEPVLRAEQEELLGRLRYQRSQQRRAYAIGSYRRTLSTGSCVAESRSSVRFRHLKVPNASSSSHYATSNA